MARSDSYITLYANTVQENEKMLQELNIQDQVEIKTKEDFEKLFIKLNYICQVNSTKDETQLNTTWCNKSVTHYTYGPIGRFPSGSWWGIRMDCSRDRVHDPFDENIQNGPFGVTSICTSGINSSEDIDFGNSLTFTGQKYSDDKSDKDPLINNYESEIPVRLIRSYNLLNEFAPKTGYRYDGLYIVSNFWIGVNSDSTKYYKFALSRLSDQEPPPWKAKQSPLNTENYSPSMYAFKKYSHGCDSTVQKEKPEKLEGSLQNLNFDNKKLEEKEKNGSESGIVTRHVFKKANFSAECAANTSNASAALDNKSLNSIGSQGSKTHNTNISIRTGLYDSSHSTQHDVKKSSLTTFCRSSKSINLLKVNQHLENSSLYNKDKSRSTEGKAHIIVSNEFPKRMDYISPNTVKTDSFKIKSSKDVSKDLSTSTDDCKDTCKSNDESSSTPINAIRVTDSLQKSDCIVHKVVQKETHELKSLDSSFDSLSPEKILHLINNKRNPLSKLLMGKMIGLSSEQVASKTYDLATLPPDSESIKSDIEDKISMQKSSTKETKPATSYMFRRRRKLSRKITNKSEIRKNGKTRNGKLQKVLPSTILDKNLTDNNTSYSNKHDKDLVSKVDAQNNVRKRKANPLQESGKHIKTNLESKDEVITRLRTMRTIKSSMKKQIHKKHRREIANLLIDAKIGPKIRGPRNRRLRCINNMYAKQSYEPFSSAIRTLNKRQVNSKISKQRTSFKNETKFTSIGSYNCVSNNQSRNIKRSELNLRQSTAHRNLSKNQVVETTVNGNNFSDDGENNRKDEAVSIKNIKCKNTGALDNRKRKLLQTTSVGLKSNKILKNSNKETLKPCKTDAITQCSLLREPLIRNNFSQNSRSEHYTFIKIEYGDVKDMKSEVCEITRSGDENRNHRTHRSEETQKCCIGTTYNKINTNILNKKKQSVSEERVSAFVPVNTADSDLKIARLRSLGFKPITSNNNDSDDIKNHVNEKSLAIFSTKVLEQNAAEKFNKYTNEENDVVVYMDDELQYQDIEDEDKNSSFNSRRAAELKAGVLKNEQLNRMLSERDSESPWHGWKKVVTNKNTYWIGW